VCEVNLILGALGWSRGSKKQRGGVIQFCAGLSRNQYLGEILVDGMVVIYDEDSPICEELLSNAVDGIDQAATALMPSTNRIP
jgi:hypothetical protein